MVSRNYLIFLSIISLWLFIVLGTFRTYLVLGGSEAPTIMSGDKVIINRSAYDVTLPFTSRKLVSFQDPVRGDLVLCIIPEARSADYWIKRVIGLPGDTIEIKNNRLVINGITPDYLNIESGCAFSMNIPPKSRIFLEKGLGLHNTVTCGTDGNFYSEFGPVVVEQRHYFVLGDNRVKSMDSRIFGSVPRECIFGKYLLRISGKR